MFPKTTSIASALYRTIREIQKQPNFVYKTGTSYMNTLAAKWKCPMVAYGPGDSSLDHTSNEHISMIDFNVSCDILKTTIQNWVAYEKMAEEAL